MDGSTPSIFEFDPKQIPFQYNLLYDIRKKFDYSKTHEILCSGSVGSSKSLLGAHLAITHCLLFPKARVLLGRRTLPSLKDTLVKKCIEHLGVDIKYETNKQRGTIWFPNGSVMIPYSWADNAMKVRSEELSAAVIEELSENDNPDFYHEIRMRVGRLNHVKEKWIVSLSNPDSPSSWIYNYFKIGEKEKRNPTHHVYYSKTSDNPFLPENYIRQLEESLDPKMVRRMIYGEWLEINDEMVYYGYDRDFNFSSTSYEIKKEKSIHISFDFNIGVGKPMSSVAAQYDGNTFHFFAEKIIEGARTENIMEEWAESGVLDVPTDFIINGDSSGRRRDTRSNHSDWDIIRTFLEKYRKPDGYPIRYKIDVPLANPKIRNRHNIVNGHLHSSTGLRRVRLYHKWHVDTSKERPGIKVLDEGFRLTKLKNGASYLEDDTKYYQHCTTAAGYLICSTLESQNEKIISSIKR